MVRKKSEPDGNDSDEEHYESMRNKAHTMKAKKSTKFKQASDNIRASQTEKRGCMQRIGDFIWLDNPEYFYIVTITEHIGCFKGRPRLLILLRLAYFLVMCVLIGLNFKYFNADQVAVEAFTLAVTSMGVFV